MRFELFVECVGCQISIIRPAHCATLINTRLGKEFLLFQWLEHGSEQPICDAYLSIGAIIERHRQGVFWLYFHFRYSAHDNHSSSSILLRGRCCSASCQSFSRYYLYSTAHSMTRAFARLGNEPSMTSKVSIEIIASYSP